MKATIPIYWTTDDDVRLWNEGNLPFAGLAGTYCDLRPMPKGYNTLLSFSGRSGGSNPEVQADMDMLY